MSALRTLFFNSSFLLLAACGGGGGSGGDRGEVLSGQLIDSVVAGVRFTTQTRSGVTDIDGRFEYLEGETVDFYLGELVLGDAQGAAQVSLFDLVDGVSPVVGQALQKAVWGSSRGPSFSTVINLATLLQTLDGDGNPDNGIEISPDVAALFSSNSVDFDRPWREFHLDSGVNQAMAQARSRTLLDKGRHLRTSWQALRHLYASLGIDSELDVATTRVRDRDGDGTPNTITQHEFDAAGRLIRVETDDDADGIPDEVIVYSHDAQGNLIREERNWGNNGAKSIAIYTYDSGGSSTRNRVRTDMDNNGNGSVDEILTYDYDADGNLTRMEIDSYGGDGVIDLIMRDFYDEAGNRVRSEYDYDADGTPESVSTYAYNMKGDRIRTEYHYDGDGTVARIHASNFDEKGNRLTVAYDLNGDGVPNQTFTSSYDLSGNRTRYEEDTNADGAPDTISTYVYDANGNEIRFEYDGNADGAPDEIHTRAYDAQGHETRREVDADANGWPDQIVAATTTYDPNIDVWWSIFNASAPSLSRPVPLYGHIFDSFSGYYSGSSSSVTLSTTSNALLVGDD